MRAIQAAAVLGLAMVEGKFEIGTKDAGKTLSFKYIGPDLDGEGDVLEALLYLAEIDGLTMKGLQTDGIHISDASDDESGASAWHEYDSNPIDAEARMKKAAAVDAGTASTSYEVTTPDDIRNRRSGASTSSVGAEGKDVMATHCAICSRPFNHHTMGDALTCLGSQTLRTALDSAAGTPWELLDGFNVAVSLLNEVLPSLECAVDPAGCEAADVDPTNYCTACMVGQFVTYRVPYVRASVPGTGAGA